MADFGGFEVKTPQEVMAEIQAQQQRINSIQDPQTRRLANIHHAMANAFGSKELRVAKANEQAMEGVDAAMGDSGMQPGTMEFEQARLEKMYHALKTNNPTAASQVAAQLTQLDEQRFERKRLEAQSARAEQMAADQHAESFQRQEKNARLNTMDNVFYIEHVDPQTGESSLRAYNPGDPESRVQFERDKLKPGAVVLSREEAADRNQNLFDDADMKLHNNSSFTTKLGTYEAQRANFDGAGRIVQVLAGNPNAMTGTTGLVTTMNEYGQEALALHAKALDVFGVAPNDAYNDTAIGKSLEGFKWYTQLDAEDQINIKSLTLNMAYVLARSLDPSGRLSDADVMFASRMIGASQGDPRVMVKALTDQIYRGSTKVLQADATDLGSLTEREIRSSQQARRLKAQYDALVTERDKYMDFVVDTGLMTPEERDMIRDHGIIREQRPRRRDNRPGGPGKKEETWEEDPNFDVDLEGYTDDDFKGISLNGVQ